MNDEIGLTADIRPRFKNHSKSIEPQAEFEALAEQEQERWVESAIETYESPLLRYAKHFVGDIETARDVVQDTFLQLCRNPNEELRSRLAQWLYTVCRNRAIDVIRKEKRMKRAADQGSTSSEPMANAITDPADQRPGPRDVAEQAEDATGLMKQIGQLPDRQQEVLRLKFHGGLSYKEIAQVMGLTSTNVGFILHTAISKLRQRMVKTT
ncbi:MAG: sigma-70 family RNA polymerase sigma factor [Planctomycetota bacterium]